MQSDEVIINNDQLPAPPVTTTIPVQVKAPRRWRLGRALLYALTFTIIGLAALLTYISYAYAGRFLPNTTIAGLPVAGLTPADVKALLVRDVVPQHQIEVTVGEEVLTPAPADLGVKYPLEQLVEQAYAVGREQSLLRRFLSTAQSLYHPRVYQLQPEVDTVRLKEYAATVVTERLKEAADAVLVIEKGEVALKSASFGQAIDQARLEQSLLAAAGEIRAHQVTAEVVVVMPAVTDEALTAWKDRLVAIAKTPVVITAEDKKVTLTTEQKLSWYSLDKQGTNYTLTLKEDAVRQTVLSQSKKLSKTPVNEQVTEDGQTLAEGKDGFNFEANATLAALLPQLRQNLASAQPAGVSVAATVTPVAKQKVVAKTAPTGEEVAPALDTDGKLVQISLAKQRMYLFENRQLINVFAISSGKRGYETPKGVHRIYNKALRPWSRPYQLYLPYWNAITSDGAYGIHDLPEWPGGYKEPETHLGTPVSHGCIRLGSTNAKYFYQWAPVGTPVVVQ